MALYTKAMTEAQQMNTAPPMSALVCLVAYRARRKTSATDAIMRMLLALKPQTMPRLTSLQPLSRLDTYVTQSISV